MQSPTPKDALAPRHALPQEVEPDQKDIIVIPPEDQQGIVIPPESAQKLVNDFLSRKADSICRQPMAGRNKLLQDIMQGLVDQLKGKTILGALLSAVGHFVRKEEVEEVLSKIGENLTFFDWLESIQGIVRKTGGTGELGVHVERFLKEEKLIEVQTEFGQMAAEIVNLFNLEIVELIRQGKVSKKDAKDAMEALDWLEASLPVSLSSVSISLEDGAISIYGETALDQIGVLRLTVDNKEIHVMVTLSELLIQSPKSSLLATPTQKAFRTGAALMGSVTIAVLNRRGELEGKTFFKKLSAISKIIREVIGQEVRILLFKEGFSPRREAIDAPRQPVEHRGFFRVRADSTSTEALPVPPSVDPVKEMLCAL